MSHDPSSRDALSRNSLDVGPTASLCGRLGCPHSDISPSFLLVLHHPTDAKIRGKVIRHLQRLTALLPTVFYVFCSKQHLKEMASTFPSTRSFPLLTLTVLSG